jgi:hypothetical protein
MSMQPEQGLAWKGSGGIYRVSEGCCEPSEPGAGQSRILILISILLFPHRTTNMTSTVTINLRWRCCPGNRATRSVFTKANRDRAQADQAGTVSFFRTHQAALEIHLYSGLRCGGLNTRQKDESFVRIRRKITGSPVVREAGPSPSWRTKHATGLGPVGSPSTPCFVCLGKAVDGRPAPAMTSPGMTSGGHVAPPETFIPRRPLTGGAIS